MESIDFTERNSWGFKDLNVDDVMPVQCGDKEDIKAAQRYAHTYGRLTGKKFATRTQDGVLYVKRTK